MINIFVRTKSGSTYIFTPAPHGANVSRIGKPGLDLDGAEIGTHHLFFIGYFPRIEIGERIRLTNFQTTPVTSIRIEPLWD